MNIKSFFKKMPGSKFLTRLLRKKSFSNRILIQLSNDELLSLMRHDTHRIEKAVYNNILMSKKEIFQEKKENLSERVQHSTVTDQHATHADTHDNKRYKRTKRL